MAARLARAPIPWRELRIVPVILAIVGGMIWWGSTPRRPRPLPDVPIDATFLRQTVSYASKYGPPTAWIDAELPDHRRVTVTTQYPHVAGCRKGGPIHLLGTKASGPAQKFAVAPEGCRETSR